MYNHKKNIEKQNIPHVICIQKRAIERNTGTVRGSYGNASPSTFPPSPMTTQTGASSFKVGKQAPFIKSDSMFETPNCKIAQIFHQQDFKKRFNQRTTKVVQTLQILQRGLKSFSKRTYRSFKGMYMSRKHNIHFVFYKPCLKHIAHCLPFHIVNRIAVVKRNMHNNHEPWCLCSIYLLQLLFEPVVLWTIFNC